MNNITINEIVAARLRAERAAADLTQTQVADQAGISLQTLQRYEKAKRSIPTPTLFILAKVIGFDIAQFIIDVTDRLGATRGND